MQYSQNLLLGGENGQKSGGIFELSCSGENSEEAINGSIGRVT